MGSETIERMFVNDADLIDAMAEASRAESAAAARRILAVGELYARRSVEWSERELWCTDPFEAVAAEVSTAQNISRGRAGTQIRYARELRERLTKIAEVFAAGDLDLRMVSAIVFCRSDETVLPSDRHAALEQRRSADPAIPGERGEKGVT